MNVFPDNHLVEDIATALKTRAALLEKDWYVPIVIVLGSGFTILRHAHSSRRLANPWVRELGH